MASVTPVYKTIAGQSKGYFIWLAALALLVLVGALASHHMESYGHVVTGMNNQVV